MLYITAEKCDLQGIHTADIAWLEIALTTHSQVNAEYSSFAFRLSSNEISSLTIHQGRCSRPDFPAVHKTLQCVSSCRSGIGHRGWHPPGSGQWGAGNRDGWLFCLHLLVSVVSPFGRIHSVCNILYWSLPSAAEASCIALCRFTRLNPNDALGELYC